MKLRAKGIDIGSPDAVIILNSKDSERFGNGRHMRIRAEANGRSVTGFRVTVRDTQEGIALLSI